MAFRKRAVAGSWWSSVAVKEDPSELSGTILNGADASWIGPDAPVWVTNSTIGAFSVVDLVKLVDWGVGLHAVAACNIPVLAV